MLILVPLLVAGILFFFIYSIRVMDTKAAFANAVRFSQAEILLDTNIVLGDGLGHAVSGIGFGRVYNGNIYFELQTLYIFNQIGATGIFLFYALTFLLCMDSRQKMKAYLIYLVYTFWNPYCFDSTHIIALLIISNALNSFAGNGKKVLHMEKRKQRKSILKLGDIKT